LYLVSYTEYITCKSAFLFYFEPPATQTSMAAHLQLQKPYYGNFKQPCRPVGETMNTYNPPAQDSPKLPQINITATKSPSTEIRFFSDDVTDTTVDSPTRLIALDQPAHNQRSANGRASYQHDIACYASSTNSHPADETKFITQNHECDWLNFPAANDGFFAVWPRSQVRSKPSQATNLQCRWEGCLYRGTFAREGDLIRHIKGVHISRDSYICQDCNKRFNRQDNLNAHIRRCHK
jgi:uncharacterized Zn-finger protein